jgi:hypothetical protein
LSTATGKVASIRSHRYGVKFELLGHDKVFNYPSKHQGSAIVLSALELAGDSAVTVRHSPVPHTPWFSDVALYSVWQVTIADQTVLSYAQAQAGWRSDEAVRPWLAGAFALCTCYLAFVGWRAR